LTQEVAMNNKWKFKAHFNRINMQRGLENVWTVHFRGQCIQCTGIRFECKSIETKYIPEGQQPRATLNGYSKSVEVRNGIAIVT
jgi:hypothetical protein